MPVSQCECEWECGCECVCGEVVVNSATVGYLSVNKAKYGGLFRCVHVPVRW